jgi:hypothetical protein
MNIKNIVAVSGLPGLFKLVTSKSNGIIVADVDSGKTKFCSVRQHQFTPMETVAIYTEDDTVDIRTVFQTMLDKHASLPLPVASASHGDLIKYFEVIIPDYDRDKVYHSDMKKVIKWYNFLNDRGYLTAPDPDENEAEVVEEVKEAVPVVEEKPKKSKKAEK